MNQQASSPSILYACHHPQVVIDWGTNDELPEGFPNLEGVATTPVEADLHPNAFGPTISVPWLITVSFCIILWDQLPMLWCYNWCYNESYVGILGTSCCMMLHESSMEHPRTKQLRPRSMCAEIKLVRLQARHWKMCLEPITTKTFELILIRMFKFSNLGFISTLPTLIHFSWCTLPLQAVDLLKCAPEEDSDIRTLRRLYELVVTRVAAVNALVPWFTGVSWFKCPTTNSWCFINWNFNQRRCWGHAGRGDAWCIWGGASVLI